MRTMRMLIALGLVALLGACTWVKMAPGAREVRVVRMNQDMSACERRGEIAVSVKDRLGPYERNEIRVRDELEVLARNEAPGLGADTVQPKAEPADGEQRFLAFRCCAARPGPAAAQPAGQAEGEAETFPIED